jgi:hypothetical protein
MTCQELRDLIPDYLAGELSVDELGALHAHLAECEACRMELEQAQSLWRTLGEIPEEEPGPALRGRFYAMLEEEKRRLAGSGKEPLPKRIEAWLASWWPRRPALQAAVAVGLLIIGLAVGSGVGTSRRDGGDIAELRGEIHEMREMVSLSLLGGGSTSDRLRGVNWSSRIDDPTPALLETLSNTLRSDPSPNVRLAAVDALGRFYRQPGVVDVLTNSLTSESSPMVQVALIDILIAIHEQKTLEALKRFVEMQNVVPEVKEHAEKGISGVL